MSFTTVSDYEWAAATSWLRELSVHDADRALSYEVVSGIVKTYRACRHAEEMPAAPDPGDVENTP